MMFFQSESEMQKWISDELKKLEGLGDLIVDSSKMDDFIASSSGEKIILRSYNITLRSLWLNEPITENENISISSGERLRPDFLLYAPETESVVVLELKNIAGPTREAGTELGAYTGEVRTVLPFISSADIVHVIISNEWPVLLRHYIFHEIFWYKRNVLCLKPTQNNQGKMRLSVVPPSEILLNDNTSTTTTISERHLGGYQICLYDVNLMADSNHHTRLDQHVEQMRSALYVMAAEGNSQNGHGFAFLWRDLWTQSLAPYSITVLNFCPFQTVERFLHLDLDSTPQLVERLYKLVQNFNPEGHGNALSEITHRCEVTLEHFCRPKCEGFSHWGALKKVMVPRADFIAFCSWGLFADAFTREITERYRKGDLSIRYDCPDLGMEIVEKIVDEKYPFIDLCHVEL
jgi:hypothetical protein